MWYVTSFFLCLGTSCFMINLIVLVGFFILLPTPFASRLNSLADDRDHNSLYFCNCIRFLYLSILSVSLSITANAWCTSFSNLAIFLWIFFSFLLLLNISCTKWAFPCLVARWLGTFVGCCNLDLNCLDRVLVAGGADSIAFAVILDQVCDARPSLIGRLG